MKKDYFFFGFLAFIFLRFILSGPFLAIHSIIIFSVPIIYIVYNRQYHIFKFDINDTVQSIVINFLIGFLAAIFLIAFMAFFGNFNWVNIFDFEMPYLALLLLLSFNYELLVRHLFQGIFIKKYGDILGIFLASFFGSIYLLPDFLSASAFFIAGLGIGYVYSKTNDIYGASLAGFLIRVVLAIA